MAVAIGSNPLRRDAAVHRYGRVVGIGREEFGELESAHAAVEVIAAVAEAGQPRHPVRHEHMQQIRAVGASAVRHLAALEHRMRNAERAAHPAQRQAAVAGTDDDHVHVATKPARRR
jgi:hypothetical protein